MKWKTFVTFFNDLSPLFSLPALGIDTVLQEFNICLEDICSESDVHLIDPVGLSKVEPHHTTVTVAILVL